VILVGNIIFRNFVRLNFRDIEVCRFHTGHYSCFERVAFLNKFSDAFGIGTFYTGQSLDISGLTTRPAPRPPSAEARKAVRDSLAVGLGGQLERAIGMLTSLGLRWGLDPGRLGVYNGLRLFLDNTNRSSLGVGIGAVRIEVGDTVSLDDLEREHIRRVLARTPSLDEAAAILGIDPSTLYRKRKRFGL